MFKISIAECFNEERSIFNQPNGRIRIVYSDNDTRHRQSVDVLQAFASINTKIENLAANTTEKTQPLDQFIIKGAYIV